MKEKTEFFTNFIIAGVNGLLSVSVDDVSKILSLIGLSISVIYNCYVIVKTIIRHVRNKHRGECDCGEIIKNAVDDISEEVKKNGKKGL